MDGIGLMGTNRIVNWTPAGLSAQQAWDATKLIACSIES